MKTIPFGRLALACAFALYLPIAAYAAVATTPRVNGVGGRPKEAEAHICVDLSGAYTGCGGETGGDASAANQTAVQANAGSDASKAVAVQGVTGGKAVKVDGSAVTQPVSAASLPLPTGAATAANQASPGTAGSASSAVVSVQGIASMTPLQIGGNTATTVAGSTNAVPSYLLTTASGGNTWNFGTTSTDALVTSSSSVNPMINSVGRLYNGSNLSRIYQASAAASDGTGLGVQAVEEAGRSFNNITTATTTTVKSGKGFLHALNINTPVGSATITIYDNTAASGTKIGTITLPATITATSPQTLIFNVAFGTGLTVVTSGATDLTVTYR